MTSQPFVLRDGAVVLEGTLDLPRNPHGIVVFSHGSGSSRHSPRNRYVAQVLQQAGFGTLLFDLLCAEEDKDYRTRFDIDLLTRRLALAVRKLQANPTGGQLPLGLFGASTGAASALRVAAMLPDSVAAVVSRGGRPDLAGDGALRQVCAPILLIVGSLDEEVLQLNESAFATLAQCERQIQIVPGATHLFEEPGALEQVAELAAHWFSMHLTHSQADAQTPTSRPAP